MFSKGTLSNLPVCSVAGVQSHYIGFMVTAQMLGSCECISASWYFSTLQTYVPSGRILSLSAPCPYWASTLHPKYLNLNKDSWECSWLGLRLWWGKSWQREQLSSMLHFNEGEIQKFSDNSQYLMPKLLYYHIVSTAKITSTSRFFLIYKVIELYIWNKPTN